MSIFSFLTLRFLSLKRWNCEKMIPGESSMPIRGQIRGMWREINIAQTSLTQWHRISVLSVYVENG